MNEVAAGARLQLWMFRKNPGHLLIFFTTPFFACIFLSGIEQAGKTSLIGYAVFGPALIGTWLVSLDLGGTIIDAERLQQTFELHVITPFSFSRVLLGRVGTISVIGMLTFVETVAFARVAFGVNVRIDHPLIMTLTLIVTGIALAGTSTAMAALFTATRQARSFSSIISYPFYIIGGIVVPTTLLPLWVRPLGWLTYLYWSAGLLRAAILSQPVADAGWRLLAVLGLGLLTFVIGQRVTAGVINALRRQGTIGLS
jgi:ABC-2 type transport system permease protein